MVTCIPSQLRILGNKFADSTAKAALILPHVTELSCYPIAVRKQFLSGRYTAKRPRYNSRLSRKQCIMLASLRIGKAIFNSKHYYDKTDPPKSRHCNVILTISHILTEYPISEINSDRTYNLTSTPDNRIF